MAYMNIKNGCKILELICT